MQTVQDILGKANYTFFRSVRKEELEESAASLAALLKESWLNDKNRESAEALLWRIQAKARALVYFEEGYNEDDFSRLISFAEEKGAAAEEKGYGNTAALLQNLGAFAREAQIVMSGAAAQAERVRTYDWQPASSSEAECREVAAIFAQKLEAAEKFKEKPSPFGKEVSFPPVAEEMAGELEKVRAFAENRAEELRLKDDEGFFAANAEEIEGVSPWANAEYFPELSRGDRALANAVVLCTPFPDEAELFAVKNSSAALYRVYASSFAGRSGESIANFFSVMSRKNGDALIYGAEKLGGEAQGALLLAAVRFGRGGRKAFLVDPSGDRQVYSAALRAAGGGGLSAVDISFEYLSMPLYEETVALFEEKGMIRAEDGDYEYVRKNLPFIGFTGLNRAVSAFASGKDWRPAAAALSAERTAAAHKYLEKLPSQALFIDGGWGELSEDKTDDSRREFDYDDIRSVNPANVKKIVAGGFTVFEKIGLLVRYCTLAGDDVSSWQTMDKDIREARICEATVLVMRALGIGFDPEVAVLDELENKGAGGLCCDGGKRILFKRSCTLDYEWMIDSICHECYHAFQHMVEYGPWNDRYWTDFGVTKGRKAEWLVNTGKKYFSNTSSAAYLVQVVEAEARAFAKDCLRDSERVWHTVDFD